MGKENKYVLLSILIMDTCLVYSGILGSFSECQNDFYGYLMNEIIDNIYDDSGGRLRSKVESNRRLINDLGTNPLIQKYRSGRCGLSVHLTPIKRKGKTKR